MERIGCDSAWMRVRACGRVESSSFVCKNAFARENQSVENPKSPFSLTASIDRPFTLPSKRPFRSSFQLTCALLFFCFLSYLFVSSHHSSFTDFCFVSFFFLQSFSFSVFSLSYLLCYSIQTPSWPHCFSRSSFVFLLSAEGTFYG